MLSNPPRAHRRALQWDIATGPPSVSGAHHSKGVEVSIELTPIPSERWRVDFESASEGQYPVCTYIVFFNVPASDQTLALAESRCNEVRTLVAATNAKHAQLHAESDRRVDESVSDYAARRTLAQHIERQLRRGL